MFLYLNYGKLKSGAPIARQMAVKGRSEICLFRNRNPEEIKHIKFVKDSQAMHCDEKCCLQIHKFYTDGEFYPIYCSDSVIAYSREGEKGKCLVAVNNSPDTAKIFVGTNWDNSYNFFDPICVDGIIELPPYRYTLLSKQ